MISGACAHRVVSHLYVAPVVTSRCSVTGRGGRTSVETCTTAWGFGVLQPATVHRVDVEGGELQVTLGWLLEWPSGQTPERKPVKGIVQTVPSCKERLRTEGSIP